MVIRATNNLNLQRNIVARQVERNCCSYYLALKCKFSVIIKYDGFYNGRLQYLTAFIVELTDIILLVKDLAVITCKCLQELLWAQNDDCVS